MPPSTRSNSKQNSPVASRSNTRAQNSPTTTPRKRPHCKACHQPMQGHPKTHCPSSSPSKGDDDFSNEDNPLTSALGSMKLQSPERIEVESKAFILDRRRKSLQAANINLSDSVQSLSTSSSELASRLAQSGVLDNGEEGLTKVVQWQDTIKNFPTKPKISRQFMPCTLVPPTPDHSFAIPTQSLSKEENISVDVSSASSYKENASSASSQRSKPLARSMSAEERDLFICKLRQEARATIYIIPKDNAINIQAAAANLKIASRVLMNDDEGDSQALFVVAEDEYSIQKSIDKIEEKNSSLPKSKKGQTSGSGFAAVAGGAVAGALGAWAGLAYS